MEIKATLSGITASFTPDEWGKIKKLLDFMVSDIERMNGEFLELVRQNPDLTVAQLEARISNNLLSSPTN